MVPKYTVGNRLYFCPSIKRMPHGTNIPAGMVEVTEVVDHGESQYDIYERPRFTYVVIHVPSGEKQGTDETELHVWEN